MTAFGSIPATTDPFASSDFIAPGIVKLDTSSDAAPSGWLECDGSLQLTATYPALQAAITHRYNGGADPGGGQFRLPDFRDAQPLGSANPGAGVGGAQVGTKGAHGHGHNLTPAAHAHTGGAYAIASHGHNYGGSLSHFHDLPHPQTPLSSANDQLVQVNNKYRTETTDAYIAGGTGGSGTVAVSGSTASATPNPLAGGVDAADTPYQLFRFLIKT